jgi:predicted ATPase
MINQLTLKNFKSIKSHTFPLRNLNVVLGLNGMGKSTFVQSLLLLRQSNFLSRGVLRLDGDHFSLGSGRDAFYQYGKDENLTFDITFTDGQSQLFEFKYNPEADYLQTVPELQLSNEFFDQALFKNRFQYLSANRADPVLIHPKSYSVVKDARSVGDRGQFAVHFLSMYGSEDITFTNVRHENSVSDHLLDQVNSWLGEISPGVRLNIVEIPNSESLLLRMQYVQPTLGFTNPYSPMNVGFGISFVLPVVVSLLSAKADQLILIENPESHIHPRGQAELGRLITLAAMNDIQVIVETHSDHVLNGIRVAVKEHNIPTDKVALFHFEKKVEPREQFSKITNIEVDTQGELSVYPKNLLDEWSNQLVKLI